MIHIPLAKDLLGYTWFTRDMVAFAHTCQLLNVTYIHTDTQQ